MYGVRNHCAAVTEHILTQIVLLYMETSQQYTAHENTQRRRRTVPKITHKRRLVVGTIPLYSILYINKVHFEPTCLCMCVVFIIALTPNQRQEQF